MVCSDFVRRSVFKCFEQNGGNFVQLSVPKTRRPPKIGQPRLFCISINLFIIKIVQQSKVCFTNGQPFKNGTILAAILFMNYSNTKLPKHLVFKCIQYLNFRNSNTLLQSVIQLHQLFFVRLSPSINYSDPLCTFNVCVFGQVELQLKTLPRS